MTDRVCSSVGSQAYSRPCRETYCSANQRRSRAQVQPAFLRPRRSLRDGKAPSRLHCQADDSDEKKLDLLRQEETSDGAILFVFGDAEDAVAGGEVGSKARSESEEAAQEPEVAPKQKKKGDKSTPKSEAAPQETKKAEKSAPKRKGGQQRTKKSEKSAPKSEVAPQEPKKTEKSAPKSEVAPQEPKKTEKSAPKSEVAPEEPKKTEKSSPELKVGTKQPEQAEESAPKVEATSHQTKNKVSGSFPVELTVASEETEQDDPTDPDSVAAAHSRNTEEPPSHFSNDLSEELADMTVVELKRKCKDVGMKGYSRLKKGELIDALQVAIEKSRSETAVM
ncbi:hypothetical protein BSKO_09218 [Bryopsis sp. KO-2023]|nr:hypothetical protein BSKO_09218 [Bryopsis sp. KO-2023]